MPNKVEAARRDNYWENRRLYRVLKDENVSSQISFAIAAFPQTLN